MKPYEVYERIIASVTEIYVHRQGRILTTHHMGEDNPIKKHDLVMMVYGADNSSTERKVRDNNISLVKKKIPVCALSGTGGYYVALNDDEKNATVRELRGRAREINEHADALSACIAGNVTAEQRAQALQRPLL